jgi:outer membrane receptor protein involved in Fe transport
MKRALTGAPAAHAAAPAGEQVPTEAHSSSVATPGNAVSLEVTGCNRAMLVVSAAAASIMTGMPVFAASPTAPSDDTNTLGEVVVTANKLNSTVVLETPASIQAISGQDLQKQGVAGFMDIAAQIPGLSVQDLGPGDRKYVIRGINSTGDSTTGVYYDEAVISGSNANDGGGLQSDIRLYDLDHIEVLRGPQGTLYGASSESGTIRFITKKPNLTAVGGYLTGEASDTNHGAGNYNLNGALNLPIIADKLALRIVGWGVDDSGYIDQIRVGAASANPLGPVKGVNWDKVRGGRAILRFQPFDDLTIDASYTRQSDKWGGSSRYTPAGVTAFAIQGAPVIQGCDLCNTDNSRSPGRDELSVYSLTVNSKMRYGTLTGTTNQYNRNFQYNIDQTPILAAVGVPLPGEAYETISRKLNSSEIRFASDFDFPVNFVVGGYRQHETADLNIALLTTNGQGVAVDAFSPLASQDALLNPGVGATFFGRTDDRTNTDYAGFGEVTWSVTPQLKLTAGLRYFTEKLEGVQQTTHPFAAGPVLPPVSDFSQSDSKVTSKFNASYKFNDALLVYASAAQGFRAGGLNAQVAVITAVPIPPSFAPDTLWDYEGGVKGRLFDHLLEYQVDAYWIDWKNIQVQEVAPPSAHYTGNAGNAVAKGVEFEFTVRPIEHLRVDFSGSFQNAHLKTGATAEQLAIDPTLGRAGDKLADVAPFQYALGLNYTAPLTGDWIGTLAADITYRGKANAYFESNPFNVELNAYTVANLRAQVSTGPWTGTLFVRNVGDERAQVSAINSDQDPHALLTVRPRTVGVSFTRTF